MKRLLPTFTLQVLGRLAGEEVPNLFKLLSKLSCQAVVAEWLRRLTRNQIPSGSVGSNPTNCEEIFCLCSSAGNWNLLWNGQNVPSFWRTNWNTHISFSLQTSEFYRGDNCSLYWAQVLARKSAQTGNKGHTLPRLSITAWLAQSVEHETLNLRVVGSSPTLGY